MTGLRDLLRRPGAGLLLAATAVALLSALSLAWFVPPLTGVVASTSYRVGYNNAVAALGVLCAIVLASLGGVRAARSREEQPAAADTPAVTAADTPAARDPRMAVDAIALAAGLVAATAVTSWLTLGVPFSDHLYFFTRYAYALQGAMPYAAFDFPYGPVLLYLPVVLFRAFGSAGADAAMTAYYVAVALEHALGVALLWYAVERLPLELSRRRALFWIVGGYALLTFWAGPNYSLLRFAAPVAAIVMLARAHERAATTRAGALKTGLLALGLVAATAAVSPELAAAVFVAAAAMNVRTAYRGDRTAWWGLAPLACVPVAALLVSASAGTLLADFMGGALNLPVLPSPLVMLYLASVVVAAFGAGRALSGAEETAGAVVGLAAAGAVLVVPALGRADIGHVFWNGLPMLVAAALVLSGRPGRRFAAYMAALAVVFVAGAAALLYVYFVPAVTEAASFSAQNRERAKSAAWTELVAADRVAMPFGAVDDLAIAYALRGALVPMHGDYQGPVSERQFAAIERDLEGARWVVLPASTVAYFEYETGSDPATRPLQTFEGLGWSVLLQFPVSLPQVRRDYAGFHRLAELVAADFAPGKTLGPYVLMERKQGGDTP